MQTMDWNSIPSNETIEKTKNALIANGIKSEIVNSGEEAKKRALEMIPEGSEVMNTSSVTVDSIGLSEVINESGKYNSVKNKLNSLNRETDALQMQKLGAAPEYMVGSVHAVTLDGKVLIASNMGSQLPGYSYGASHVIWIVGAQKIVENLDEGLKRINDYILPLESDRLGKRLGKKVTSFVSKLLIINREIKPDRITMIIVKESLGF